MDIKIGAVRYTPRTSAEKVAKIESKEGPGTSPFENQLRICGVHRWNCRSNDDDKQWFRETEGKDPGRTMSRAQLRDALKDFTQHPGGAEFTSAVLSAILRDVGGLAEVLASQRILEEFSFTSTSVLLYYDASGDGVDTVRAGARLIDFANSGARSDDKYFPDDIVKFGIGVNNLASLLEEFSVFQCV